MTEKWHSPDDYVAVTDKAREYMDALLEMKHDHSAPHIAAHTHCVTNPDSEKILIGFFANTWEYQSTFRGTGRNEIDLHVDFKKETPTDTPEAVEARLKTALKIMHMVKSGALDISNINALYEITEDEDLYLEKQNAEIYNYEITF